MPFMELSEKRLGDIIRFAEAAQANGWGEGTSMPRYLMAPMVGMSMYELDQTIRAIKENPDLGISVSTRRGSNPFTIVSFQGERLDDEIIKTVHEISDSKAAENFKRTIRDASTSFVAYQKADKTRANARAMKPYVRRLRAFLMSIHEQAVEDNDPFGILEMSERALATVGVHYDSNHAE